jgi:hypothetical protein
VPIVSGTLASPQTVVTGQGTSLGS